MSGSCSPWDGSEAHHGAVVFEPALDLATVGALEAIEAEVLDVEAGDDGPDGHGALERGGVGLAGGGEVAHEAAGEAVAGAGRIDDLGPGGGGHHEPPLAAEEHRAVLPLLDDD